MYGIGLIIWCVIAIALAGALSRLIKSGWTRRITFLVLVPVVFLLPLVDELIGKFQFDRLCDEAKDINIFATIPVGEELYFPDGRWRISSSPPLEMDEHNRVQSVLKSMLRYETTKSQIAGTAIPITTSELRTFESKTGRLLGSYRTYYTKGGWLSRWGFEKPSLVRDQCYPQQNLEQSILPFRHLGDIKRIPKFMNVH